MSFLTSQCKCWKAAGNFTGVACTKVDFVNSSTLLVEEISGSHVRILNRGFVDCKVDKGVKKYIKKEVKSYFENKSVKENTSQKIEVI